MVFLSCFPTLAVPVALGLEQIPTTVKKGWVFFPYSCSMLNAHIVKGKTSFYNKQKQLKEKF
jgi:hypothetical protein